MSSTGRVPSAKYQVRWMRAEGEREQQVEYPFYSQAEACFISLFSVIDRARGGWAGLWEEERCLLDVGRSEEAEEDSDEESGGVAAREVAGAALGRNPG